MLDDTGFRVALAVLAIAFVVVATLCFLVQLRR